MAFVYITCKNEKEAKKISMHLLKKRLIACSNMFPLFSMYRWKGKIVKVREYGILGKTRRERFPSIERETSKIHPYDTPCICLVDAKSNREFERWVKHETR